MATTTSPTLRRATADDLHAVAALVDRYFREWDIWERDSLEALRAKLAAPVLGCFIAEAGGALLGCVFGHACDAAPAAAECKRLYVVPEARGLGLAKRLMQHLEAEALRQGFASMYLDSKEDFAAALQLYRSLGYAPCERYNSNPQATFFFRKPLR